MAQMFYYKGLDKCMGRIMGMEDKGLSNKQDAAQEVVGRKRIVSVV
ncbi:hypothetical protein KA005_77835 [bacterium]|nr:hypothetical protein [bacterium]